MIAILHTVLLITLRTNINLSGNLKKKLFIIMVHSLRPEDNMIPSGELQGNSFLNYSLN